MVDANAPEAWDKLWREEGSTSWRGEALAPVYKRIAQLTPREAFVIDIGGGVGQLLTVLRELKSCTGLVVDHSQEACTQAREAGFLAFCGDVREALPQYTQPGAFTCTEVIEHLSESVREALLRNVAMTGVRAFFSVPNNRLGPDEEPQHTIKWTAKQFLDYMRMFFGDRVRVEVPHSAYLLAVVGNPKAFKLSVCTPARNEAADIGRTLASFRGVADELVVGIDPRSSDETREIAEQYADLVFDLRDPEGPPEERVPDGGVHFAWIRNQCMERCTGDWIFMTEAHEHLEAGHDALLFLDQVPAAARVAFVLRTGQGQQWGFPWLCRNAPDLRYKRSTHNILDYPEGTYVVQLPEVRTNHVRDHRNALARKEQRKIQNRITLLDDWLQNANAASLHYLGAEWREHDPKKAVERLEEYLALPVSKRNGPMRYHTKLILAKLYAQLERYDDARSALIGAEGDDWSRIEHWFFLGDLATLRGEPQEAVQWFLYASTRIGNPPFTLWWIDLALYGYLTAQRLAVAFSALGDAQSALNWARKVAELLPEAAPLQAREEVQHNIQILEEAINVGSGTD